MESANSWYCLRSRPKQEHIAAAHLALLRDVEVYCPRLRMKRDTRRGPAWFTEALFPGYLFCRFDRAQSQKAVACTPGVSGIVRFGGLPAMIPDRIIAELRCVVDGDQVHTVATPDIQPNDTVTIVRGPFQGLKTLVSQAAPASKRISVILDILGNCHEVMISRGDVFKQASNVLCQI